MGTFTPVWGFYKPAVGETGWGALVDTNFDIIDGQLTNSLPRSYLAGLGLVNNAGSPNTKIDIGAGVAQDAGNAGGMTLAATLTKDISAVWAVGSGNGGLATALGAVAPSTTYHLFLIKRTDTSVVDAYFDTSVTAANIPSPYTLFRRVGSRRTSGASAIIGFTQDGDYVRLNASVLDVTVTNPGTVAVTATLTSVPTGVPVQALLNAYADNINGLVTLFLYLSDLAATDEAPSRSVAPLCTTGIVINATGLADTAAMGQTMIRTNASSQIRYRINLSNAVINVRIVTLGWWDTRGRNA